MRFVDASVFVYAYLKPKKTLPDKLKRMKNNAKAIVARINAGESTVTSVVHLSEVANILEARITLSQVRIIIEGLILKESLNVLGVTQAQYQNAVFISETHNVGINDALAKLLMDKVKISEIYSFDMHFDTIGMTRITE
ncbi:MAG: type II toxin-antitoxin system VapC family toxin [Candidatus Heimdallarchaeota archaeon]